MRAGINKYLAAAIIFFVSAVFHEVCCTIYIIIAKINFALADHCQCRAAHIQVVVLFGHVLASELLATTLYDIVFDTCQLGTYDLVRTFVSAKLSNGQHQLLVQLLYCRSARPRVAVSHVTVLN